MIWIVSSCRMSTPRDRRPAVVLLMRIVFGWSEWFFTTSALMFRMMSVMSSTMPGMVEISCCTPWILILVIGAAFQARQQDAPQAVADGHAEAAFERLDVELRRRCRSVSPRSAVDPARQLQATPANSHVQSSVPSAFRPVPATWGRRTRRRSCRNSPGGRGRTSAIAGAAGPSRRGPILNTDRLTVRVRLRQRVAISMISCSRMSVIRLRPRPGGWAGGSCGPRAAPGCWSVPGSRGCGRMPFCSVSRAIFRLRVSRFFTLITSPGLDQHARDVALAGR